MLLYLEQ